MRLLVDRASAVAPGDEFARRFSEPLISFFRRRIGDRSQAEDLAQEVLLRVIRAAESGSIEHADSYVFKVAANLLCDYRRRARRNPVVGSTAANENPAEPARERMVDERSPERVLVGEATLAQALQALGELGDLTRNVFMLFRLENMRQKDIAALYGIAQSTVEKHVMRAVLHLARRCGGS